MVTPSSSAGLIATTTTTTTAGCPCRLGSARPILLLILLEDEKEDLVREQCERMCAQTAQTDGRTQRVESCIIQEENRHANFTVTSRRPISPLPLWALSARKICATSRNRAKASARATPTTMLPDCSISHYFPIHCWPTFASQFCALPTVVRAGNSLSTDFACHRRHRLDETTRNKKRPVAKFSALIQTPAFRQHNGTASPFFLFFFLSFSLSFPSLLSASNSADNRAQTSNKQL